MKDRYLFKAKRINNGEWVEGNYLKYIKPINGDIEHRIFASDNYGITWYVVDEKTICQYTGLTDKNGNKIWENDIVIGREGYCGNSKLPTREIEFKVEYSRGYYRWLDNADMYEFEVIGNIFDNPELLKGGAE